MGQFDHKLSVGSNSMCMREVIYVGRSAQRQNRGAQLQINLTNTSAATQCAAWRTIVVTNDLSLGECKGILDCAGALLR